MTILQFANNATTTLAQNITGISTTIFVAAGTGVLFPQPISGFNFLATIYNTSSTLDEVVLVTARTGDQFTVVRAQEGTIAQTWIVGDTLGMYPTKGTMEKFVQNDQLQNGKYTVVQAAGTANALTCQITSDLTSVPDGMTLVVKPTLTNTGAATLQVTMGSTVLSAVPIVKGPNLAIQATDIPSAGYPVQLIYSAIYGAWVMQMPSTLISPPVPPTYTIQYLAVAGGGGGGIYYNGQNAGGGGAGGLIQNYFTGLSGTTIGIFIGGGGSPSANGTDSYINGVVTTTGGGGGGSSGNNGSSGGSGGGGAGYNDSGLTIGGSGLAGQGFNGGGGINVAGGGSGGGGGGAGGAGQQGKQSPASLGGDGGIGLISTINGSSIYYAGGGGGSGFDGGGAGGLGGGGAGGGGNGAANKGAGGGGISGNGGSGVIILSMLTSRYTGVTTGSPTVFTSGSNTILTYTSSGTYTA
jgi:hypothetical protein